MYACRENIVEFVAEAYNCFRGRPYTTWKVLGEGGFVKSPRFSTRGGRGFEVNVHMDIVKI